MLLTELQLSRRRGLIFPQPERMKKVQKSMGAIRQVLGERKRDKIAAFREQQPQQEKEKQPAEEPAMNFHE
jgi:Mitochondrial 39-S ribosomal protein L47 (MRP-L47)